MELEIKVRETKKVRFVRVDVGVRYKDEDMPFLAPMRKGDRWQVLIDVAEKRVIDWPKGEMLSFEMKVCDDGIYELYVVFFHNVTNIIIRVAHDNRYKTPLTNFLLEFNSDFNAKFPWNAE